MAKKYQSVCKFCGKFFVSASAFSDVCFDSKCQRLRKKQNSLKGTKPKYTVSDVIKLANKYTKQCGRTVTYGQASLFLEHGIKTF